MNEFLKASSDEFGTPQEIFDELNARYQFNCDAAATIKNAKCCRFFNKEKNGLEQSWEGLRVFCNPPYSNGNCKKFALKAFEETAHGCELAVILVPTKTEQAWFHILRASGRVDVHFFKKRLKFDGGEGSARDSHMLLVIWPPSKFF